MPGRYTDRRGLSTTPGILVAADASGVWSSAVASQLIEVLRSQFWRTLTLQEAEHIANATVPRRLQPNARICHQGKLVVSIAELLARNLTAMNDRIIAAPRQ